MDAYIFVNYIHVLFCVVVVVVVALFGIVVVVQLLSRVQLFVTPWTATCQVSLSFQRLPYVPELAQTHVHQVDEAIQPSHPLLPPSPPALNLSQHQGPFQ